MLFRNIFACGLSISDFFVISTMSGWLIIKELKEFDVDFDESMLVVLEYFEVIYRV